MKLTDFLVQMKTASVAESKRLVRQGAVRVDGAVVKDLDYEAPDECIIKVGRRQGVWAISKTAHGILVQRVREE